MRLFFQIVFAVAVGFGALYAGVVNFYLASGVLHLFYGLDLSSLPAETLSAIDSSIRLLSGMWIAAGLVTLVVLPKFEQNTNILRMVLLGMALGAIGELMSKIALDGDVTAAVIKASVQVAIYLVLEVWRSFLCRTQTA